MSHAHFNHTLKWKQWKKLQNARYWADSMTACYTHSIVIVISWCRKQHCLLSVQAIDSYLQFIAVCEVITILICYYLLHNFNFIVTVLLCVIHIAEVVAYCAIHVDHRPGRFVFRMDYRTVSQFLIDFY